MFLRCSHKMRIHHGVDLLSSAHYCRLLLLSVRSFSQGGRKLILVAVRHSEFLNERHRKNNKPSSANNCTNWGHIKLYPRVSFWTTEARVMGALMSKRTKVPFSSITPILAWLHAHGDIFQPSANKMQCSHYTKNGTKVHNNGLILTTSLFFL